MIDASSFTFLSYDPSGVDTDNLNHVNHVLHEKAKLAVPMRWNKLRYQCLGYTKQTSVKMTFPEIYAPKCMLTSAQKRCH